VASIFGHGIVGFTLATLAKDKRLKWLVICAIGSSILPDIDVLTFYSGVPYEHPLGHRGFTHSILFAIIWAALLMIIFGKERKFLWFLVIFFSTLSHGILDAMTTGGRGVGFLIPFNHQRFFFPWRKIVVSPIRVRDFFSDWGVEVILSELKFLFLPCFFIFVMLTFVKKIKY